MLCTWTTPQPVNRRGKGWGGGVRGHIYSQRLSEITIPSHIVGGGGGVICTSTTPQTVSRREEKGCLPFYAQTNLCVCVCFFSINIYINYILITFASSKVTIRVLLVVFLRNVGSRNPPLLSLEVAFRQTYTKRDIAP